MVVLAMISEQAINLAAWCRPDLVLTDIRLAESNAVEAAQAIHIRWAIPSLFATSHVENSAATCHAALGCLRKPYADQSLVRSIQIVEQVMNGFEPTLSRLHNLELYQIRIKQSKCSLPGKSVECHSPSAVQNNAGA
jgi:two-component SAPR family response regulator